MSKGCVGLIGVGLLGTALAERFLLAGFDVCGFDIDAERYAKIEALGGRSAASPAEVAAHCRRIVLCLPDSQVVASVLRQLLAQEASGTAGARAASPASDLDAAETARARPPTPRQSASIVIDTTTGDPEQMAGFAQRFAENGVDYLDATVSGSSGQVRTGDAIAMVGGKQATFVACSDLFASFARRAFYLGPSGSGARMKLVVNLVLGLNRAVLAEGLMFAAASGVDPAAALEVLKAGPAYSRVMDLKGERMLRREYEPEARLSQHLKDVRIILEQAKRNGCVVPLSKLHEELLALAESSGFGDRDNSAVIEAFSRLREKNPPQRLKEHKVH